MVSLVSRFLIPVLTAFLFLTSPAKAETFRDQSVPIGAVSELEIGRFLGLWYEIARFPNWFEKGCQGVTAEYGLREDGRLSVRNTCHEDSPDGPVRVAEGLAWMPAPGRLKVTFTPFLPFINGDYWVLDVDDDYQLAVIGNPAGETGWILARNPQITPAAYQKAVSVLQAMGYDSTQLERVAQ